MRVTVSLIAVCVFVFVLQTQTTFGSFFVFDRDGLPGNFYTILTSIFAHGGLQHLFYNMIALFFFGSFLEGLVGEKNFFGLFLLGGILANVFTIPFYSASLGASGAIYGVLGALAVLKPKQIIYINLFIPLPLIVAAGLFLLFDVIGVFVPSNVGNLAHISGLGIGVLAGFYWRKYFVNKKVNVDYFKDLIKE